MATSGSTDFTVNGAAIVKGALRLCGKYSEFESVSAEMMANGQEDLNLIIKSWMADGLQVWLQEEGVVFPKANTNKYILSPLGDHAATDHIKTEVATAASSGTTLVVDSTTGMTALDNIGLELDDGTVQWTTIASITDSTTLEMTVAITSATAIDNHVYTYTPADKITMPWKITEIWHNSAGDTDVPLIRLSRNEYTDLSLKTVSGFTTEFFYDRQLDEGFLHVWPQLDNVKTRLKFYYHREVEDFDTANDTPDVPKYYLRALKHALAADIGPSYGVGVRQVTAFEAKAVRLHDEAMGYDNEEGSIFLGADERG